MSTTLNYKTFFGETEDLPQEFWGNEGAGVLFVAKDTGRILLFLRSDHVNEPNTWNLVGGKIDYGETPKEAVAREIEEETGYGGDYKMGIIHVFKYKNFRYYNYLAVVPFEFTPQLNWEHSSSKWIEYGEWPSPLHFGLADVIKHSGNKIQRVIKVIKRKHAEVVETVDVPPAIVHRVSSPSPAKGMDEKALTNSYIVAATVWDEARGEGEQGMRAVLNVIMNRAKGNFEKARDVVLKPKQFSGWNNVANPEEASKMLADDMRNNKTYQKIIDLVDKAFKGQLPDITGGALFYFNPKKVTPSWAKKLVKTKSIGNHDFYKVPKKVVKKKI